MLSLPGLWVTPSGLKLCGTQDHCGPFPSFLSALWLVPVLAHLPDRIQPSVPSLYGLVSVFRRDLGAGEYLPLLEPSRGAQVWFS